MRNSERILHIMEGSKERKKCNKKLTLSDKMEWESTLRIYGAQQVLLLL